MANIKSIGGNPIVLGLDGLSDEVTHGYNPALSVGRADALTGADDTARWATRESTGSGAATVRSVQGAAVVWEQQIRFNAQSQVISNGVTFVRKTDGTVTANGTATADAYVTYLPTINSIAGHKYLVKGCPAGGSTSTYMSYITGGGFPFAGYQDTGEGTILSPSIGGTSTYILAFVKSGFTAENLVFRPMLFDLTQMFGSGNEPTTVAEFEAMFPASYYPYSSPTLKPVQIAGIASTDAQGGELDSVEWETQTLRAAGSVRDVLYSDHVDVRVGVVDLGTLTWRKRTAGSNSVFTSPLNAASTKCECAQYTPADGTNPANIADKTILAKSQYWTTERQVVVRDDAYTDAVTFKAAVSGVLMFYQLDEPTTTPISPALPMTYRVQAGGSESIIVPDGEVSAAPVLTVAEGESAAELVMDALACIATPDGPVATANHSVGTYLTMGGKLYKVTRAIASGETIASGTNVTATTVMAELLALAN